MALTKDQFEDLLSYLREHPEGLEQLRPIVLGEMILATPGRLDDVQEVLREIAAGQAESDRRHQLHEENSLRFDRQLEEMRKRDEIRAAELEAIGRRMDATNSKVDELVDRMDATNVRVDELVVRIDATNARLDSFLVDMAEQRRQFLARFDRIEETLQSLSRQVGKLGNLDGKLLQESYERNAGNWFRHLFRRARLVHVDDIAEIESALADGRITDGQVDDLALLDVLVSARRPGSESVEYFAFEVSSTLGPSDLERVVRRAAVLSAAGVRVTSILGGHYIDERTRAEAERQAIIVDIREPAA